MRLYLISALLVLSQLVAGREAATGRALAQIAPSPVLSQYLAPGAASIEPDDDDTNYLEIAAPDSSTDDIGLDPCETTTFPIYQEDLVNLTEMDCNDSGILYPYTRAQPFGISWTDDNPLNCSITTVTIAIDAGTSCAGDYGSTSLNSYITPSEYRFPYNNEYQQDCDCSVPDSPIQIFNFHPRSAYNQGGRNTFMINNSTGSNGLRSWVANASIPLYGLVITNQWTPTTTMNTARTQFGFATTQNNKVLAAGGVTESSVLTNSAEEYDPINDVWTYTRSNLSSPVQLNQVAALNDKANPTSSGSYFLISAGGIDSNGNTVSTVDMYNTTSREFSAAPAMKQARARHTLTSIFNGSRSAIAVGGVQGSLNNLGEFTPLASVEAYSWDANAWYLAGNMSQARYRHQAVMLPTWQLLIMGGQGTTGNAIQSVESLSFSSGNITTAAPMLTARYAFTATVLRNGSVLVTGGAQLPNTDTTWVNSQLLASCELYVNGTWYPTANLTFPRAGHQAILQDDGNVLVVGGGGTTAQTASELWNAKEGIWVTVAPLPSPKINFGVGRLDEDRIIAFGGSVNSSVTETNGTLSSYVYTIPFTTADLEYFTMVNNSPSPAGGPAQPEDSYRAPPIQQSPPAPPTKMSPANIQWLYASGPLPANASFEIYYGNQLSGGAIAGIVIGAVGGALVIIGAITFILWRRRVKRRAKRYTPEGLNKIINRYGSNTNELHSNHSHILMHKEDGTPFYVCNSNHSSHKTMEAVSAGGSMGHYSSRDFAARSNPSNGTLSPYSHQHNGSFSPGPVLPGDSFQSVEMSHAGAFASPFGAAMVTQGAPDSGMVGTGLNGNSGRYGPSAVVLPRGLPSPFQMDSGIPTRKSSGLKSLKSIDEGTTTTTGGTRSSPDTHGSQAIPLANRANEASAHSDLSRVSLAVRQELHAADWRIDSAALSMDKRLGKGGFGEVFRGTHHGSPVAIKILEMNDERTMQDACQEFGHLHNLRHSKLVVSYGACIDGMKMMLVMELMEEDLFHAIGNDQTGSGDSVLWNFRGWQIAVDIASALVFLHSKGLVHLDVKSLNILLKGRRTEAKLGDLGLAKLVSDGHLALQNTLPGTPAYSAPEVIQAQLSWRLRTQGRRDQFQTTVGTPADIFAFGVVLFEIITGQHPARWRQDFEGKFRPDQASPEIAQLVDDCLNDEPEQRPTARQVLDKLRQFKPAHLR